MAITIKQRKTAVVTGAAGGIGKAVARRFADSGFRLILADAAIPGLQALAAELNQPEERAWAKPGDLRSKAYCEALLDYSIEATGRLDVLINNAGIITRGNILET